MLVVLNIYICDVYLIHIFTGDKDRYSFPAELSTIHAEYTYFYFPGDFVFPRKYKFLPRTRSYFKLNTFLITVPPNKIFVHVNPVQVHFHLDSCLWLNSFLLNLHESLLRTAVMNTETEPTNGASNRTAEPSLMYMDVKLEVIMPRVNISPIMLW